MDIKFCGVYIQYIYDNIINLLRTDDKFAFEESTLNIVKKNIEGEIFKRCFKSLLYGMNVERVDNKLTGNTPEERYAEFSDTEHCIMAMKDMFPTMEMQIYDELKEKCKYLIGVTSELEKDIYKITTYFFNKEIKKIQSVTNSGDWHNNKCVLIFSFEGGYKVVYKPTKSRNLEFLKHVLSFFFEETYLGLYDFMYYNEGIWVKFVEYKEVNNSDDIKSFYKNYGQIIFISYLLGINDLHYENLIASGLSSKVCKFFKFFYWAGYLQSTSFKLNLCISTGRIFPGDLISDQLFNSSLHRFLVSDPLDYVLICPNIEFHGQSDCILSVVNGLCPVL